MTVPLLLLFIFTIMTPTCLQMNQGDKWGDGDGGWAGTLPIVSINARHGADRLYLCVVWGSSESK